MVRLTAQQVYNKLINEDRILTLQGQIKFFFGDVDIIVKQKDVVGNIIQEWVQGWLDKREIEYALNDNTQMPPDFYLNPDDLTTGLLEVKAFNRNRGAGFDIADFRMYEEEIVEKPFMLNVDYLIFGYDMGDDGTVVVKDLWLKKVWQITCSSDKWPMKLQVKQDVVHKIRPGTWYGNATYPPFERMEDFISAIEQTVWQNPKTREISGTWLRRFLINYERFYGERLTIPRWNDIENHYRPQ